MAYKQRWAEYFEVLDANHSGTIDMDDATESAKKLEGVLPPPQLEKLKETYKTAYAELIKSCDANKDGKVTKDEFTKSLEHNLLGKTFDTAPGWFKHNVDRAFDAMDQNGNGELSEEEVVNTVLTADKNARADQVKHAYHHVAGSGKFDRNVYHKFVWTWFTSPNPEPEVNLLMVSARKTDGGHAYKRRWEGYFDVLDANNNGFIDVNDVDAVMKHYQGLPPAQFEKLREAIKKSYEGFIKASDTSKDGKVGKAEFINSLEKHLIGKTYEQAPDWFKDNTDRAFDAFDENKNGELSEAEVVKAVTQTNKHTTPEQVKAAYHRVKGAGKYDKHCFQKLVWSWFTSPNPVPDAELLLVSFHKNS